MSPQVVDGTTKFLIGSGLSLLSAVLAWITIIPKLGTTITIISGLCFAALDLILFLILVQHHIETRRRNGDPYPSRFSHFP